jgi:ketosteroid isomerase-like protein
MRYIIFILLLFVSIGLYAQKPDLKVMDRAIADFDKALLNKDSVALNHLLSNNLFYGHSNGWVETKKELIADLFNGKLVYKTINPKEEQRTLEGNTAAVRSYAEIDCVMDGKPLSFKLKVLQVWIWKNKHWELFARQSVKI